MQYLWRRLIKDCVDAGRGKLERAGHFSKCIHILNSQGNIKSCGSGCGVGPVVKLFDFFSGLLKLQQHSGSQH